MANDLIVRVDATTAQFDRAMSQAQKAALRYGAQLKLAQKAQLEFDAAVASSGASSEEAALAQQKLGAALARTTEAEIKAGIAAKQASEIQVSESAKAAAAAEAEAAKVTAAADKQAAAQARLAESRRKSLAGGITSVTGLSATTSGWLAVGAAVFYAAKQAAEFDAKMATLRSLSRDATAGQLEQARQAAFGFTNLGISASSAADAEIELQKAGIGVSDQLSGALRGALTLAAAGQLDVGQATEIAASAMTQFQLSGKDIPHLADLLTAGADKALGSVADLGDGLKYAGLSAHQAGLSIDQTVGALSEFAQAGLIGSQGGTTLQQVLRQLLSPTAKAAGEIQHLGITLYDQKGKFVGLASVAGQLQKKLGGMTQAQRNAALGAIFTSRAIRGANILYQDGAKGVESWAVKVNDSGFAAEQAAGKMDSLQGDLQKLAATWQNAFTEKGEGLQTPLRSIAEAITAIGNAAHVSEGQTHGFWSALGNDLKRIAVSPSWTLLKGFIDQKTPISFGTGAPQAALDRIKAMQQAAANGNYQTHAQQQLFNEGAYNGALDSVRAMGGALVDLGQSGEVSATGLNASSVAAKTFADSIQHATGSVKQLTAAFKADQDALSHRQAMRDYADSVAAAVKASKDANTTTRQMNTLLDQQASAALNAASTMVQGSKQQIAYLERARTSLYNERLALGDTKDEARKYVDTVLDIPDDVKTKADIDTVAAEAQIKALQTQYNLTPKEVKTVVTAAGATTAATQVRALRDYINALRSRTIEIQVNQDIRTTGSAISGGHVVFGQAAGGYVRGPGGPTDDRVLRALSNGEFVQRATAVNREGVSRMQALNEGRATIVPLKGFADGGYHGRQYAASSSQTVVMTDPGLRAEVRALRREVAMLRKGSQHVTVDNATEVATGVRGVAKSALANATALADRGEFSG